MSVDKLKKANSNSPMYVKTKSRPTKFKPYNKYNIETKIEKTEMWIILQLKTHLTLWKSKKNETNIDPNAETQSAMYWEWDHPWTADH